MYLIASFAYTVAESHNQWGSDPSSMIFYHIHIDRFFTKFFWSNAKKAIMSKFSDIKKILTDLNGAKTLIYMSLWKYQLCGKYKSQNFEEWKLPVTQTWY